MRTVGIQLLEKKVSEYVRLAASGERILVTDRDRVVAELVPPAPGRLDSVDDARLVALVRHGFLTPPLEEPSGPPPSLPRMPLDEILEGLDRDRAER